MSSESDFLASAHSVSGEGYEQRIRVGTHALTSDEPEALGGKDAGPSPYALVLSGLAACTAITLKMYAGRKGWSLGEVKVDLRIFREGQTERVERTVTVGGVTDEQLARLGEIAEKTPVTKTLKRAVTIATTMRRA